VRGHPSALTPQICTAQSPPSAPPVCRSSLSPSTAPLSPATTPLTAPPHSSVPPDCSPLRPPGHRPSAGPLCSPSRCSSLTGHRSPHRPTPPLYTARPPALCARLAVGPQRWPDRRPVHPFGVGPLHRNGPLGHPTSVLHCDLSSPMAPVLLHAPIPLTLAPLHGPCRAPSHA
jgi:hypothetical protein